MFSKVIGSGLENRNDDLVNRRVITEYPLLLDTLSSKSWNE